MGHDTQLSDEIVHMFMIIYPVLQAKPMFKCMIPVRTNPCSVLFIDLLDMANKTAKLNGRSATSKIN